MARPRTFDPDTVLDAALQVFWSKGFHGTSFDDITAVSGLTKPSLYAAFGNKEALFHKALDLYEREKLAYMSTALEAPTARGVAERLLRGALEIQTNSGDPKGCLGVISANACGVEAESIKAEVVKRRASSEAALLARFERAKSEGDLPKTIEPDALVRYLFALMQGLSVQAGSGATCAQLSQLVETSLALWPTR